MGDAHRCASAKIGAWPTLISTAIKKALKVALYDFFDGPLAPLNGQFKEKVNHYNRTKHKDFLMGPSVKFVLAIIVGGGLKHNLMFSGGFYCSFIWETRKKYSF